MADRMVGTTPLLAAAMRLAEAADEFRVALDAADAAIASRTYGRGGTDDQFTAAYLHSDASLANMVALHAAWLLQQATGSVAQELDDEDAAELAWWCAWSPPRPRRRGPAI